MEKVLLSVRIPANRPSPTPPHFTHLTRREFLQIGYSGALGLGLSSLASAKTKTESSTFEKQPNRGGDMIRLT
jgi:hypothetical protein